MKAMILAAGYGTRLKPLTDTTPKALIPYKGKPLIVHQIDKLKSLSITEIIINTHHLKEQIIEFFDTHRFGIKISLSVEDEILGTGGGIINAEKYLKNESHFLVVNADVISDINFNLFSRKHSMSILALLAVQKRNTSRYLEFDDRMKFRGRASEKSSQEDLYAFNAMHMLSNKIFELGYKAEFKDIIDIYEEQAKKGKEIKGFDVGDAQFKDIGKPENLV